MRAELSSRKLREHPKEPKHPRTILRPNPYLLSGKVDKHITYNPCLVTSHSLHIHVKQAQRWFRISHTDTNTKALLSDASRRIACTCKASKPVSLQHGLIGFEKKHSQRNNAHHGEHSINIHRVCTLHMMAQDTASAFMAWAWLGPPA